MDREHIFILLVCPENPDNIGAAARAMKNMGFSRLRLVQPPTGWRKKAKKMAMSAGDVLRKAVSFPSLAKAIDDLAWVVGTTRRAGGHRGTFLSFERSLEHLRQKSKQQKIGIVFGRESKGLANDESALCDHLMTIPTAAAYPSLNLAQAVMAVLFALSMKPDKGPGSRAAFLNKKEINDALFHFEKALEALGYPRDGSKLLPRILQTLRGMIKRSGMLQAEGQMIKGLSRRIQEKVLSCGSIPLQ